LVKLPIDKDLQEYLEIRSSRPPPAIEEEARHKIVLSAQHARGELESRLRDREMTTGIHYLDKFDEIQKALTQVEIDKRIAAEAKVSAIIKWCAITVSGIVVVLVSSLIIWFVTKATRQ
jgi:hypothetical protein